ncbi:MAG: hypothetical protein D6705_16170 [Deltaproteobacteria bacterium]|nr:MAG: hypothetical protein D6705_16170 [Deltaproteobacteria bacterium]
MEDPDRDADDTAAEGATEADARPSVATDLDRRRRALMRATARRASLWTGLAVLATVPFDARWGLALTAGTLLGLLHLLLLSRQTMHLAAGAAARGRSGSPLRVNPAVFWLKWPFWALALGGVLWYMRARPEGVVAGLVLALAAFATTARRHLS